MQGRLLCVLAATVVSVALFTGAAFASGPAAPGKEIIQVTCEGLKPLTVSVPRSEKNTGAGQIVGEKGHGIEVTFTRILTDLTTEIVLSSEPSAVGGGHAHPHQATTTCTGVAFAGSAAEVFGKELPPGVGETDSIQASFVVGVFLKP
jgi:hypothetical protein